MIEGFPYRNQGDAIASGRPDAEAICLFGPDGVERITFGEFVARADAVADRLLARGLAAGDRVAILGLNSIDWLLAFYGTLRAGLVAVPVSYKFPGEVLDHVLDNSGSAVVLVDRPDRLAAVSVEVDAVPLADVAAPGDTDAQPRHERAGSDAAMILYTSGSTGMPKGVVLSQDSHLWVLAQGLSNFGEHSDDVSSLVAAPLYHMNALANVQALMLAGSRTVLLPTFDAGLFLRAIAEERPTRLTGVPPMFALLLKERALLESLDLGSVREIYMGSAPASDDLFAQLRQVFPGVRISFGYGTTESGPVAFAPHPDGIPTPTGSVGVANPAVDIRLVDHAGRESGDQGVMEIRTGALFTEYFRRPDIPSPITEDGFYHTRDEFRRDEQGFFYFTGRSDDMFSSGGENVYPRSIELALEEHPDVSEAAVVPLADDVKGARPVAFVVPAPGATVDEQALREWSLTKVEPFAHPRRVFVVDALPLSQTNKVDRALLTRRAVELAGGTA